jgi:hypothetical protein
MNRSRDVMFSTLSGRKPARFKKSKLQPVESGRFQGWTLRKDCPITDYVERKGFTYNRTEGRGFYQFTKKSKIQDYKEIILEDKATGDMFTGDAVRKILDLPTSGTIEVRPAQLTEVADQYNIFVQSTSSNRNLKAGTRFLYDIRGL